MVPLAEPSPEFFPLLSSFESDLVLLPSVVLELFCFSVSPSRAKVSLGRPPSLAIASCPCLAPP